MSKENDAGCLASGRLKTASKWNQSEEMLHMDEKEKILISSEKLEEILEGTSKLTGEAEYYLSQGVVKELLKKYPFLYSNYFVEDKLSLTERSEERTVVKENIDEAEPEEPILSHKIKTETQTAITSLYLKKQLRQFLFISLWTGLAGILLSASTLGLQFAGVSELWRFNTLLTLLALLFVPSILSGARYLILGYRIDKGYFGNNAQEAREFIAFIENLPDDDQPPGSGGMRAFPEVVDESTQTAPDGTMGELA